VPLAAAVGVALLAMLLDKLVHVLDLVVSKGGPFIFLLKILGDLVPPYLGLALPVALFRLLGRLSDVSSRGAVAWTSRRTA
jgi:lipopolysaccharide export system permease protein